MFRMFILNIGAILVLLLISLTQAEGASAKKIGIIIPIEHQALRDIVDGFKVELSKQYKGEVKFVLQNAHGDHNLQRSIIEQFKHKDYDLVVPVGTATTQMTAKLIKDKPIVSLASLYSEEERIKRTVKNITAIQDEIDAEHAIKFMKDVFPNIKKITIIHSSEARIFNEIKHIEEIAPKSGFKVQKLMIQTLPELYSVSKAVHKDSEAVFILKDHLIVSGIQTLVKNIAVPIITSDEGTVKEGADFALGVKESDIGKQGARVAAKVLNGANISDLPVEVMKDLTIFYSVKSSFSPDVIKSAAKKSGYKLSVVAGGKK